VCILLNGHSDDSKDDYQQQVAAAPPSVLVMTRYFSCDTRNQSLLPVYFLFCQFWVLRGSYQMK
jgi:hypothetical protein